MRRSARISLTLIATVTLVACEEPPGSLSDVRHFIDRQQCEEHYAPERCATAEHEAREVHAQKAPRYAQRAQCEAEWGEGNCDDRGGAYSTPQTHGFVFVNTPYGGHANPVYRDSAGSAYVGGSRAGPASGFKPQFPDATIPKAPPGASGIPSKQSLATLPTTTSRGGFGATGRAASS